MSFELGDPLPFAATFRDPAGVLANVTTVALTITAPDGTTTTPAVTNPPAQAGRYGYDYQTTAASQAGQYSGRWLFTTATGATSVYVEVFDVEELKPRFLFSLNVAKTFLNIPLDEHDDDEEIRDWIGTTTELVEDRVGTCLPKAFVETHYSPGPAIWPRHAPVISVTSLAPATPGGTAYAPADLLVDTEMGRIAPAYGGRFYSGPYTLTYLAGRQPVPRKIRSAGLIILAHLWATQRGPTEVSLSGGEDTTLVPGYGYAIPSRALELLGDRGPGVT